MVKLKYVAILCGIALAIGGLIVWRIIAGNNRRNNASGTLGRIEQHNKQIRENNAETVAANSEVKQRIDDSKESIDRSLDLVADVDITNRQIAELTGRARTIIQELQRRKGKADPST